MYKYMRIFHDFPVLPCDVQFMAGNMKFKYHVLQ